MARNAPASLNSADRPSETETDRPGETGAERDDRNLLELLQELRVAGLGVQVLFGFMLSLPFTARFAKLSQPQRDLYLASLLLAAISTALLLGPVAYHRLVFRRHQKEVLVKDANIMALSGLAAVGLAISAAVLLVVSCGQFAGTPRPLPSRPGGAAWPNGRHGGQRRGRGDGPGTALAAER